jgi:hypothetical protein
LLLRSFIAFPPVVSLAVQVDKLDRPTFALWMAVMRRVPHSTLWLLRPSKSRGVHDTFAWAEHNALVERNLRRAAAAEGVHPSRLVFTGRENKTEHILRHAAADLFLDSLVYGAHSTATDALRGGLPVLTILGDSFPSRVAASLYASFPASPFDGGQGGADGEENPAARLLVRQSQRDFEDAAVALVARGSPALRRIRAWLAAAVAARAGLFDTGRGVAAFLYGMQAVKEVQRRRGEGRAGRPPHIVIASI